MSSNNSRGVALVASVVFANVVALARGAELWAFAFADINEVDSFIFAATTEGGALTLTDGTEVDAFEFEFDAGTELAAFVFAVGAEDSESNVVVDTVLYSPDLKNKWKSR